VLGIRLRVRVRGPNAGGYDLFLDDQQICTGVSADEAARYIRDAWLYGAPVLSEYLNSAGGVDPVLPPDVICALQARNALPGPEPPGSVTKREPQ